jgi:hypothetical protein
MVHFAIEAGRILNLNKVVLIRNQKSKTVSENQLIAYPSKDNR